MAQAEISRRAWQALALGTLVALFVVIDVTAVNVAFPSIREDLGTTESQLSWIVSGYNIALAALLLLSGRLADSWGRKLMFIPGVAIFLLGSLLSGLSTSVGFLIGARVIQAIGGAIVTPASLALVLPDFPRARRSMAIGVWGAVGALGAVFGPVLSSILLEIGNWRWIFFINVPVCVLVIALAPRVFTESKDPAAVGRFDIVGVPVGTAAIAFMMFAISRAESFGFGETWTMVSLLAGALLFPVLIWRSARHPEPLLDLSLFRLRSFRGTSVGLALYSLALTSGFLANSLFLQDFWQLDILQVGAVLTPAPLLAAVTSPLAGRYADRYGHRYILSVGAALCAVGYALYVLMLDEQPTPWSLYVPISLTIGLGVGLSIATWISAGNSDVQPEKFGVANGALRTIQQVCYAVGITGVIALIGSKGGSMDLSANKSAWTFVAVAYATSAVAVLILFPKGSATDRTSSLVLGRSDPE